MIKQQQQTKQIPRVLSEGNDEGQVDGDHFCTKEHVYRFESWGGRDTSKPCSFSTLFYTSSALQRCLLLFECQDKSHLRSRVGTKQWNLVGHNMVAVSQK